MTQPNILIWVRRTPQDIFTHANIDMFIVTLEVCPEVNKDTRKSGYLLHFISGLVVYFAADMY